MVVTKPLTAFHLGTTDFCAFNFGATFWRRLSCFNMTTLPMWNAQCPQSDIILSLAERTWHPARTWPSTPSTPSGGNETRSLSEASSEHISVYLTVTLLWLHGSKSQRSEGRTSSRLTAMALDRGVHCTRRRFFLRFIILFFIIFVKLKKSKWATRFLLH